MIAPRRPERPLPSTERILGRIEQAGGKTRNPAASERDRLAAILRNERREQKDPLTGTLKRGPFFQKVLKKHFKVEYDDRKDSARKHYGDFQVFGSDGNGMKVFNDTLGYPVGDRVVQAWARAHDTIAKRYKGFVGRPQGEGGDEFALFLPGFNDQLALTSELHDEVQHELADVRQHLIDKRVKAKDGSPGYLAFDKLLKAGTGTMATSSVSIANHVPESPKVWQPGWKAKGRESSNVDMHVMAHPNSYYELLSAARQGRKPPADEVLGRAFNLAFENLKLAKEENKRDRYLNVLKGPKKAMGGN